MVIIIITENQVFAVWQVCGKVSRKCETCILGVCVYGEYMELEEIVESSAEFLCRR